MDFSYPDFLGNSQRSTGHHQNSQNLGDVDKFNLPPNSNPHIPLQSPPPSGGAFNDILFNKLSSLDASQQSSAGDGLDSFNLPSELQGGVGNISSRRPSYAAESFTRQMDYPFLNQNHNQPLQPQSQGAGKNINLAQYASMNNYSVNQLSDSFNNFNLNANFNDFQSRRPSQLVDFDTNLTTNSLNQYPDHSLESDHVAQSDSVNNNSPVVKLENGLVLKDRYIVASADLRNLFAKTTKYFQNVELSLEILQKVKILMNNPKIVKLIMFIKNLNNLTFNHKVLCLVLNKNGKFDLLSYHNNSNLLLQKGDLVIVDGDRGKDLVMILDPLIDLNFAIFFNFLKKIEHLKSLSVADDDRRNQSRNNDHLKKFGGTHSMELNASYIVNDHSNEDNEFIITLPTKQVLRFATAREIHKISGKFLEEKKAFITCYNKIKELNLQNDLQLINVEYQSDFKKLIFYYYANFKRIDFRGLIKELFKIYKTRIWLCAVLPYDNPDSLREKPNFKLPPLKNSIPIEYNLSNDQILNFSVNELDHLNTPNYFHSRNLNNLVDYLSEQVKGSFYGFDDVSTGTKVKAKSSNKNNDLNDHNLTPKFNPF
ncbi:hypothetical protein CANTEDRAFT_129669 [Yamadazyma tenuis ATCC 10573]|uniref:PSP1 C-terminal domain-containing protein n=1 Tax=Candida tenuis (strain ATCC 10573 / BCRC 21748 / CBS 615 / JCM 9827 / NBRC 10315 / NRRL Y-1498 / VKM Y-70) TaxID=590646 RepID=G3B0I7_CANTC|nr:uncharacterized protein CANTEDRAFT_129669 [Yamadazyma tenuis ATCC 10573]EGV65410.1 hypothetical protein CANTEDRAFT_129669 [Yamadazyma tenuis ATCC 10573]